MAAIQRCTYFKLNSLFGEMRKNGKLSTNKPAKNPNGELNGGMFRINTNKQQQ